LSVVKHCGKELDCVRALVAREPGSNTVSSGSASHEMQKPKPGSRIVNSAGVPGTLGCVARALHDGQPVLLSTWHVLFGNHAAARSPVWLHESGHRFSGIGKSLYGTLGNVHYAGQNYYMDCAVASYQPRATAGGSEGLAWPVAGYGSVESGGVVTKAGAASGLTRGVVVDVNYSDTVFLHGKKCVAERQFLVRSLDQSGPFAVEGDSGAVVVDSANRAVGLLWGTRVNGEAVVTPIAPVLFAMNIAVACPV
jgi:hypothetical protein